MTGQQPSPRSHFAFGSSYVDATRRYVRRLREVRGPGRPRRNEQRDLEWARRYRELDLDLNDPAGLNGERPISKEGLAVLVACEDREAHPGEWSFDPEENALTRKRAAERVKKAIKALI
jgi:hypothetical protein